MATKKAKQKESAQPTAPLKWAPAAIVVFIPAQFAYDPRTKLHHGRVAQLSQDITAQSRTLLGCKQALSTAYSNIREQVALRNAAHFPAPPPSPTTKRKVKS